MTRWRIVVPYSQLLAKIPKLIAVKLSSIVEDDDLWNSKSTNKVFPHEVLYLGLRYNCQRLYFHSLREIINSDDEEFYLLLTRGRGLIMLILHMENGYGEVILVKFSIGTCCMFPNCWHLLHFWMTWAASFCIVGQKYPTRNYSPWQQQWQNWHNKTRI